MDDFFIISSPTLRREKKTDFIVMTKQQKHFHPTGNHLDSAPPTRTHRHVCAQAEEWSPQRAAATSRLTRKKKPQKKAKNCATRSEERRNLCEQGKNRQTRSTGPLRGRGRGPLSP